MGQADKILEKIQSAEVGRLLARWSVRRLKVVGSRARGEALEGSDLDLLVEFQPMPPEAHGEAYLGLLLDLERVLGVPVDLIEEHTLRNPFVRAALERDARVVYAAS